MGLFKKAAKKAGLPPGTLVHIGDKKTARSRIDIMDYDENHLEEKTDVTPEASLPFKARPTVTWINVIGVHDVDTVETLGKAFDIHPLVLEDIVHTGQRPKLEDMGDYLYIVLKMIFHEPAADDFELEQVSLIVGSSFVLSFQEKEGDVFQPIRDRIARGRGRIRGATSAYLAYALMDTIVDNYFLTLEQVGERMEALQTEVLSNPDPSTLKVIQDMKRNMIFLRKSVWPLRETISKMERCESALIPDALGPYLRDVYDHTIQVIDTVETFRDTLSSTLDIYLSSLSNRMNEVMKVLTIIATIFIPMTFIAGIYGMNFQFMPELKWPWGYPMFWGIVIVIGGVMVLYFKKKKWL